MPLRRMVRSGSTVERSPMSRRAAIVIVGGGMVGVGLAPVAVAVPADLTFDVFRKGSHIGTHAIRFDQGDGTLKVTSRLDLAVKVAFITAYRYEQTGQDEWQDDVLVRTRIETNDDGRDTLVVAEARDGQLAVEGPTGTYTTALGAMTDLSFWNEAITRGQPVIDSQTAELIKIQVQPGTRERIVVRGRDVEARRFAMGATKGRSGTVWYDESGNLLKATVVTRGETLNYELAG
jgi:hypothetical protein